MAGDLGLSNRSLSAQGWGLAISRQVVWSARALRNLQDIRAYIGEFAPLAAQRFAMRLIAIAQSLAEHPQRGRSVGRALREVVIVAPYIIRYRVKGDQVEIIRIRHGAQRPD